MKHLFKIGLFLIILTPFQINALGCDNSSKAAFKEQAKNIATTYDYVMENDKPVFNITFSNIPEGFTIKDMTNKIDYYYTGSEITLNGFEAGKSYRFDYYTNDILCYYSRLYSSYVNLPYYNQYYNDKICDGLNYKYCNKWQKNTLNYEEFIKDVDNYKKSLIKEEEQEEMIKGLFDYIIEFYISYYYIILPLFIVLVVSYIVYYNKKNDLF